MANFEIGKTYSTRSACDWECVFSFTVLRRTAKRITIEDRHGQVRTVGVQNYGGDETAKPLGSYSMCPVIRAERAAA